MTQAQPQIRGRFTTARITRRVDLTDELWKIWLKPEEPFAFKPGQYCTIGSGGIERPYSIVSSPHEPEIELFIELVPPPDGNLTPLLFDLQEGAQVTLRPRPKGIFVFKPEFKNHLMVATVTGIAPYVSMLRAYFNEPSGDYQYHVLEGASYKDEFAYDDELGRYAGKHSFVHFLPSVSRPGDARNSGWTGATGRINSLVEGYIRDNGLKPVDTCVYACGHPQMIENVRELLEGTGFHFEEERFWKDDE